MQLRHLSTEDHVVNPVIGVILMAATMVILATVIGTFVLGLGNQVSEVSLQASLSFDCDGTDNLTIAHESGEQIAANQVTITGNFPSSGNSWTSYGGSDLTTAGGSAVVSNSGGFIDGDTIRAVWNSQNGNTSSTLQRWTYNGQINFEHLLTEDDTVSPVTDVVLMVTVAVVLMVVIGTFVLGLENRVGSAVPQASFDFNYNGTALTVTHESGTSIDAAQANITSSVALNDSAGQLAGAGGATKTWESVTSNSEITAESQTTVVEQNADDLSTVTIRVIWVFESGSNSATLQNWFGPDART